MKKFKWRKNFLGDRICSIDEKIYVTISTEGRRVYSIWIGDAHSAHCFGTAKTIKEAKKITPDILRFYIQRQKDSLNSKIESLIDYGIIIADKDSKKKQED